MLGGMQAWWPGAYCLKPRTSGARLRCESVGAVEVFLGTIPPTVVAATAFLLLPEPSTREAFHSPRITAIVSDGRSVVNAVIGLARRYGTHDVLNTKWERSRVQPDALGGTVTL